MNSHRGSERATSSFALDYMFNTLRKILGFRTTNYSEECAEILLFTGSVAYFSRGVPRAITEKWVEHGGEISSGTTFDIRARYFFATDPSEPWVAKLFAKSVMVIHAGWIVHCIDEAFRVPISEYILDDKFVPQPPYKLIDEMPLIYVPLSEPATTDIESGEPTSPSIQTCDTLSTPTSMPRKRKHEQAYFDSPSGSLVFSGFDKNGLPRRPKKQRKLRFDPSFSPEGGRSWNTEVMSAQGTMLNWLADPDDELEFSMRDGHYRAAGVLCGQSRMAVERSPDTPDKPLADKRLAETRPCLPMNAHLSRPICASSPAISTNDHKKGPPVRTIDFTNLPPIGCSRFFETNLAKLGNASTILSAVKAPGDQVKTPKKISFADQARVRVYEVSPERPSVRDRAAAGAVRGTLDGGIEETRNLDADTLKFNDSTADMIENVVLPIDSSSASDDAIRNGDSFENDTLTLTMEDVQAMRRRVLQATATDGGDDDPIAALFELGKTFRGMAFRHVW